MNKVFFLFLALLTLSACESQQQFQPLNTQPQAKQIPDIIGYWSGDLNDLDIIGVAHDDSTEYGKHQPRHIDSISKILKYQNKVKILAIETPTQGRGFTIYRNDKPQMWLTAEIIETHPFSASIDPREKTEFYQYYIDTFEGVCRQIAQHLDNEKMLSLDSTSVLPRYVIIEPARINLDLEEGVDEIISMFFDRLKPQENFFEDVIFQLRNKTSSHQNMEYLSYVGARHAYRLWLQNNTLNVYFALDDDMFHYMAKTHAIEEWLLERHRNNATL